MAKLSFTGIIGFLVWIGCVIDFFILSSIITKGFRILDPYQIISANKSSGILFVLLVFSIIGFFGLIIFILDGITFVIHRELALKKNFLLRIVFIIFGIITLPFQLFFENLIHPLKTKKYLLKIFLATLILIFFLPTWIGIGFALGYFPGQRLGFIPTTIRVAGGSMYPTFPKPPSSDPKISETEIVGSAPMYAYPGGISILGKVFLGRKVGHGDLVVFENNKTHQITEKETGEDSGFIKRTIAIGGDTIQIKDGLVYVNGILVKEPYIARARSTFGGQFLEDCEVIKVPQGKIFVMGDNRKGSDDSRFDVGFVDLKDVSFVLPFKNQGGSLIAGWHDPTNDDKDSARITLNSDQYLSLINNFRNKNGFKPLAYQNKLALSSQKRGDVILRYDDFSFEATKSGYTMARAMADSGYSNIVYGELPVSGAFEAEELFDYDIAFPNTKEFLLNKDYQEMGIATVRGNLNNCPATIVVMEMAGYVPPNYTDAQIKSWENLLSNLKSIQGGWENLKNYSPIYDNDKNDVDRINQIIQTRIDNISGIVEKMQSNQWLSQSQNDYIKQDSSLSEEQDKLATKLNSF